MRVLDSLTQCNQMCVLLLYNQRDTYTWKDIKNISQIDVDELERRILALAHPKVKY